MADLISSASRRRRLTRAGLLLALALNGCATGPDFTRPQPTLPALWRSSPTLTQVRDLPAGGAWWAAFEDPILDGLETRAATSNLDVKMASERVTAAQVARGSARAQGAPTINGQVAYSRERLSTAEAGPIGRSLLGLEPSLATTPKAVDFDLYSVGVAASWELDLWGGKRRLREGAGASEDASKADARAALLSVQAEVARTYFQLRALQADIVFVERRRDIAVQAADLTGALHARGLTANGEFVDGQIKLRAVTEALADLRRDRASLARALSTLVGDAPDTAPFDLDTPEAKRSFTSVVVRLPSEVARHRPDIVAAEARLHAATAAIGVAQADFYPQISLSGVLSLDALDLKDLGWDGRNTSLGPSVSIPLFSGGRLRRMLELRESEQRSAALAYQQTVLNAWREVEDALSALDTLQARSSELQADLDAQRDKLASVEHRRARGDVGLAPVLTAREDALNAEAAASRHRAALLIARVQLQRALGG